MSESTYGEDVAMFELSRYDPKRHVTDPVATKVLEAAYLGARILDGQTDMEAAGWAYWNEERIGSTEPDKPPFDDYRKFRGLWIERAKAVIEAWLVEVGEEQT